VAQVGRISGPLLVANLERNGIDIAFRNNLDTTQLLYIDVNTGKIGVNRNAPLTELNIEGTAQSTILTSPTGSIANFNFNNNNIDISSGNINFDSNRIINVSTIKTDNIQINDNRISAYNTNSNLDLNANGVGVVDIVGDINVTGDVHATGNITLDGNLIFGNAGDDSTQIVDTVTIDTDVNSSIIPSVTETYNLGSASTRWAQLFTKEISSNEIVADNLTIPSVNHERRTGNSIYVASNGDDSYVGDHPNSAFATIKRALDFADASINGPVTVFVYPGTYQEELPLTVPSQVTVKGMDFRNCIVEPDGSSTSKDVFLMNGESTVSDLTIKNFQYDSINDTGYAFRFAPNTTVTTRSPYVQNVSVITQGSTTSANDPRGFSAGDAGKGALVDGADVTSASQEASMLFHSVTFITPGVDALTMTNGVRVEWLNSFTYFADRGLYAKNGVTGHLSTDGSTVKYGAEVRSIGSANVYGNYGAVSDGADCLMYLVMHNFGYIGSGKFVDNDPSRAIQTQEVTELNSGRVYFQSTDHKGDFRVGQTFFASQETGETSIEITEADVDSFTGLRVTTNGSTTIIDGTGIDLGNFRLEGNTISTNTGNILIDSASDINLLSNTNITNNLDITGNLSFGGTLNSLGNQTTDTIDLNVDLDQNFVPGTTNRFSLGSQSKIWKDFYGSEANIGTVRIFDNVITTNDSNADLEIRASGTGLIYLEDENLDITNNLQVLGTTTISSISLEALTTAGNFAFGSNFATTNLNINQNLTVAGKAQFENILVDDNFITTTKSNSDLELRASGTGQILINDADLLVQNNFDVQGFLQSSDMFARNVEAVKFVNQTTSIEGNLIQTYISNADLEISASGTGSVYLQNLEVQGDTIGTSARLDSSLTDINLTVNDSVSITSTGAIKIPKGESKNLTQGDIRFNTDFGDFEGFSTAKTYLNGVYSDDHASGFDAHPTNNTLFFETDSTQRVSLDSTGMFAHGVRVDEILITPSLIAATESNSDLEIVPDGTGNVVIEGITIDGNRIINTVTDAITNISATDAGYWKFAGPGAIIMPPGTELERPSIPETGFTRVNTDSGEMEVYTGTEWVTAAGKFENVTVADMEDESLIQSLIYG
jgi:hypothetical protein